MVPLTGVVVLLLMPMKDPISHLMTLFIICHCHFFPTDKPTINTTKLPKVIPVFKGYPEQLVCEADGHPPPEIRWHYSTDKVSRATLIASEAGIYNCSATNELGSISYVVEVILKGTDTLLKIHVALKSITTIFFSIYCII